jgi:hypothetical protein
MSTADSKPSTKFSFFDSGIEFDALDEVTTNLKSEALKQVARTFRENAKSASTVLVLPLWLVARNTERLELYELFTIRLAEGLLLGGTKGPEGGEPLQSRVAKEWAEKHQPDSPKFKTRVYTDLDKLLASEGPQNAFQSLVFSALSGFWTSFEILVTDAWVAALNASPAVIAQQCFARVQKTEDTSDLDGKQVSVRLLSKYGFDLRQKMGDILRPKFDFTGVSGQLRAFTAAFGQANELSSIFSDKSLSELEATRHVIAHRAAVADEEFIKRTGSQLPVGNKISMEPARAVHFLNAVLLSGCRLLSFVDGAIGSQSSPAVPGADQV